MYEFLSIKEFGIICLCVVTLSFFLIWIRTLQNRYEELSDEFFQLKWFLNSKIKPEFDKLKQRREKIEAAQIKRKVEYISNAIKASFFQSQKKHKKKQDNE